MSDDYHSPWHTTRQAGQTAEGELIYQAEQQARTRPVSAAASGNIEVRAFGKKFLGFGLVLLALWLIPGADAAGNAWILPAALMLVGGVGLLKGVRETSGIDWRPFAGRRGPTGLLLRSLWAFRPRPWLIAWAAIVGILIFYGSPHLRIQYGPDGCDYLGLLGLNGRETVGIGGPCPPICQADVGVCRAGDHGKGLTASGPVCDRKNSECA